MRARVGSVVAGTGIALLAAAGAQGEDPSGLQELHRDAIVVDGHNDVTTWILDYGFDLGMDGADPGKRRAALYWALDWLLPEPEGGELRTHTDLARLRRGGVDAQFFSIFAHSRYAEEPGAARARAHAMIDALEEQVERHADELALAVSADDVRRIADEGRIAALMGLEGGHAIEGDLANLRAFHARGVRYMTLTWSNTNAWADSSGDEPRHGGLAPFGREVVREMNRLGMIVDVSHVSDETFWDVLEVTRASVMASHSSARALADHPRNMTDEMLRALGRNGGVVMINFGGAFLDPRKTSVWKVLGDLVRHWGPSPVPLALLLDHIEHAVAVAGVDHVGLGSDFDGTLFLPEGARDVSELPNVTAGLRERGFSEAEVRKILGENALRVLEEAERIGKALAPPADAPGEPQPPG